jgi:hypothetical protein
MFGNRISLLIFAPKCSATGYRESISCRNVLQPDIAGVFHVEMFGKKYYRFCQAKYRRDDDLLTAKGAKFLRKGRKVL